MSQTQTEQTLGLKEFITAYVSAQKSGKTVLDLCSDLSINPKQYAAYRNRMTKAAERAGVEVKALARKERSQSKSNQELAQILKDAFGSISE